MKNKRKLISILLSLTILLTTFLPGAKVYAYSYPEYDLMEDMYVVDNTHGCPSHVNLYILSGQLLAGYFNYTFYQTDGEPYFESDNIVSLLYHTRVENLKEVRKNPDGSYIYLVTFGVENGKYALSTNFNAETVTLTSDYKDPRKVNPRVHDQGDEAYFASFAEEIIDIEDEYVNAYCMYGDDDWIEAHIETFAAFAKEHDNPPEYQNPEIGHIDTSDTDEIRQALKDRGYEGDVLDDFLTELESEEKDEMIAENESKPIELETVDTEMTADTTASLEETNVDTEEPEESKWTHVLAWGVTIFFLIAFALGCIWQKRRKQ